MNYEMHVFLILVFAMLGGAAYAKLASIWCPILKEKWERSR